MRLLTLLLMGIIPRLAASQRIDTSRTGPYDTLIKYSYLLVPIGREKIDSNKNIPLSTGTGFFIRSQERLLLVSARHVFTNCEIYTGEPRIDTPVAVKVWYKDTLDRPTSQLLFIADWKRVSKCKTAPSQADVDTMDVTGYFKDGRINSIERLMPDSLDRYTLWPGDTIVAFGFSAEPGDANTVDAHPNLIPVRYIAHGRPIPKDQKRKIRDAMYNTYFATTPGLPKGVSGAPIFRLSSGIAGRTIVEFVGIQSGAKDDGKSGFIVQRRVLWADYHLK